MLLAVPLAPQDALKRKRQMSSRFFCETPITGDTATLTGAEAHHLLHVMRGETGDCVTLFDDSGAEFPAQITTLGRREATLAVLSREAVDRELPHAVTIGVAMPKGDRQKVLVEKLTELGVATLQPLVTERSVVSLKTSAIDKLRRLVIEASKQCGRNRLMTIPEPIGWSEFLGVEARRRWIAHPGPAGEGGVGGGSVAIAVGPEGGFSDAEVAAAVEAGWERLSLGPRILRIETAAMVAATRASGIAAC